MKRSVQSLGFFVAFSSWSVALYVILGYAGCVYSPLYFIVFIEQYEILQDKYVNESYRFRGGDIQSGR